MGVLPMARWKLAGCGATTSMLGGYNTGELVAGDEGQL